MTFDTHFSVRVLYIYTEVAVNTFIDQDSAIYMCSWVILWGCTTDLTQVSGPAVV